MYNYEITLTKHLIKILKSKYGLHKCPRCGKTFDVGDDVVSHKCTQVTGGRRYYHASCWNNMYV
jgi:hypothetical protein